MQKFKKWNNNVRYLLMVLDIFSKHGWIQPLENKNGLTVAHAFNRILRTSGRRPKYLWVDKGKEFYNTHFKEALRGRIGENHIKMYSVESEMKSSVCERWNRTVKDKLWRHFTAQNFTVYIPNGLLKKVLNEYNNSFHRSIGMTPIEASKKSNESTVRRNLYGDHEGVAPLEPKFGVGDRVRISKYKRDATHLTGVRKYLWWIALF